MSPKEVIVKEAQRIAYLSDDRYFDCLEAIRLFVSDIPKTGRNAVQNTQLEKLQSDFRTAERTKKESWKDLLLKATILDVNPYKKFD